MLKNSISKDDLQDILELTKKILESYLDIFEDQDVVIVRSALVSATLRCLLSQCETVEDIEMDKKLLIQVFDDIISNFKSQK